MEQYLEMTDDELNHMISINFGYYANSPFYGSAMNPERRGKSEEDDEEIDTSVDFSPEGEELSPQERVNLELLADLQEWLDTDFSELEVEE